MAYPQQTFELRISIDPKRSDARDLKHRVMEWLPAHGIDEFVEGVMDGLDIDNEYTGPSQRDFYAELGGDLLPVSVYKYSREWIDDLRNQLQSAFGDSLNLDVHAMETKEWLEGWKDSFKPIETERFYIYPPWDESPRPASKIALIVEPGMAFGTGQHATTQVVLKRLERLVATGAPVKQWRLCDVGTGTGILALAAHKMGFGSVAGSDIDPDAVTAAKNNADINHVELALWQGSTPVQGVAGRAEFTPPFEVVVANILFVVLEKIISDLAKVVKQGGVLILSGVLVEDAETMIHLATKQGLALIDQGELEGWACITMTKR